MLPVAPRPARTDRRLLLGGLLVAVCGGTALAGNIGSSPQAIERRDVADFEAIAVSDSIDLIVRQGAQESVALSGDASAVARVETVVEQGARGRTLVIRLRRGESAGSSPAVRATVDVVRLAALAVAGSGDAVVGALTTPTLHLSIAGSGSARLQALSTRALEVRVAGSGNVQASGATAQLRLTIAGSGDVDLAALMADDVTVSIAGSGDAQVTANRSLGVRIAGSGDVVYGGSVANARSTVAGSGTVSRR